MTEPRALPAGRLRRRCDPAALDFETTAALPPVARASSARSAPIEALRFGIGDPPLRLQPVRPRTAGHRASTASCAPSSSGAPPPSPRRPTGATCTTSPTRAARGRCACRPGAGRAARRPGAAGRGAASGHPGRLRERRLPGAAQAASSSSSTRRASGRSRRVERARAGRGIALLRTPAGHRLRAAGATARSWSRRSSRSCPTPSRSASARRWQACSARCRRRMVELPRQARRQREALRAARPASHRRGRAAPGRRAARALGRPAGRARAPGRRRARRDRQRRRTSCRAPEAASAGKSLLRAARPRARAAALRGQRARRPRRRPAARRSSTRTTRRYGNLVGRVEHVAAARRPRHRLHPDPGRRAAPRQRRLPDARRAPAPAAAAAPGTSSSARCARSSCASSRSARRSSLRQHRLARARADPARREGRAARRALALLPALVGRPGLLGAVQGRRRLRRGDRAPPRTSACYARLLAHGRRARRRCGRSTAPAVARVIEQASRAGGRLGAAVRCTPSRSRTCCARPTTSPAEAGAAVVGAARRAGGARRAGAPRRPRPRAHPGGDPRAGRS